MGTTPLGIVYPCSGSTIECEAIEEFAQTTQAAISAAQSLANLALRPPAAWIRRTTGQSLAPGVPSTVTFTQAMYDTSGMFSLGAPTVLTVTQPGTYLINLGGQVQNFSTTLTSLRFAVALNGTEVSYNKSDAGTASISAGNPLYASVMLPSLAVGNTISATALFTGTGTLDITAYMSVTRLSTT